nr:amidase [Pseudomonas sp.]
MTAPSLTLPATLTQLRQALVRGDFPVSQALLAQRQLLAQHADHWQCVTHIFAAEADPDRTLPLAGAALAHKDIFAMRGRLPHCGTPSPVATAGPATPVVQRLEQAGATTMAALGMAEFACGATGENPHLPQPVNPVDPLAAVGGSSSGSGVAVAAGLCYASLGTDTAGSVRIPAATCGVLGFKPGWGVLPNTGTHPLAPSLDTVGILARSALDAAEVFSAMLLPGQRQSLFRWRDVAGADVIALHEPDNCRIAVCFDHPRDGVAQDGNITATLENFAAEAARGGPIGRLQLADMPELVRSADVILYAEAAAIHAAALRGDAPALSSITRGVVVPGSSLPATWYVQAMQARDGHIKHFLDTCLRDHDILLTPVLGHGVPDWAEVSTRSDTFAPRALLAMFSWTSFVNYLGLPAISFPVGKDARGRPVSVQAIARPGAEALLLAFAYQAERARYGDNGFVPTPPALRG